MHELKKNHEDIKEDIQLIFHALQHVRLGQKAILTAIGERFSEEDQRVLNGLLREASSLSRMAKRLDAKVQKT